MRTAVSFVDQATVFTQPTTNSGSRARQRMALATSLGCVLFGNRKHIDSPITRFLAAGPMRSGIGNSPHPNWYVFATAGYKQMVMSGSARTSLHGQSARATGWNQSFVQYRVVATDDLTHIAPP